MAFGPGSRTWGYGGSVIVPDLAAVAERRCGGKKSLSYLRCGWVPWYESTPQAIRTAAAVMIAGA